MSLHIAINAQLNPNGGSGGIQTVLAGMVYALGQLDGPEEYVLIAPWEEPDWLKPYLGVHQSIVRGPRTQAAKRILSPFTRLVKSAVRKTSRMFGAGGVWPRLADNKEFYERLGCQVIHFPYQHFVPSSVSSVFNPHDLQHVHYPQFFSAADVEWREATYGAACRAANTVIAI